MNMSDNAERAERYRAVLLAMRLHQLADKLEQVCASLDAYINGAPIADGVALVRANLLERLLCPERFRPPSAPVAIHLDGALERLYPTAVDEYPSEPPTPEEFDAAITSVIRYGLASLRDGSLVLGPEAQWASDGLKAAAA